VAATWADVTAAELEILACQERLAASADDPDHDPA
jgi:hypothetical protein